MADLRFPPTFAFVATVCYQSKMCTYSERRYRSCRIGHSYIERAKCSDAKDRGFWHPRAVQMHMPGNIVSGMAIKCPECNHLYFELQQGDELDAAEENHEEEEDE